VKEADLYKPVKEWLEGQGFKVYPEVPWSSRSIDVVGIKGEVVVGVEMKLSLTKSLIQQIITLGLACQRVYVALSTRPRDPSRVGRHGVGILRITRGRVEVLLKAKRSKVFYESWRNLLVSTCSRMTGDGVGGVPCLDGVGPAQDCKRRVDQYKKKHPQATWRELYEKVPNHYASHRSMANALTTGLELRAHWKKLRKKLRKEGRDV